MIKMFNEVSNLLGTSLEAKRRTGNTDPEPFRIQSFSGSVSQVFSSLLLMSSGDPSKLLISLNTFATGKDRARDSRVVPGLGACL